MLNPGYKKSFNASVIWLRCPVLLEKIFLFSAEANHRLIAPIPFQKRGRRPSSRTLERVAVDAFVSQASDIDAYGEVVWS
jgi:hypothetical protein